MLSDAHLRTVIELLFLSKIEIACILNVEKFHLRPKVLPTLFEDIGVVLHVDVKTAFEGAYFKIIETFLMWNYLLVLLLVWFETISILDVELLSVPIKLRPVKHLFELSHKFLFAAARSHFPLWLIGNKS